MTVCSPCASADEENVCLCSPCAFSLERKTLNFMAFLIHKASVSLRDVAVELTQEECSTWACSEEPVKDVKLEKYIRLISKGLGLSLSGTKLHLWGTKDRAP
ncbi:uncharacterized protein LOC143672863 isoform X2 [Tamandua tetradactyla]|uniref:uncharacterized protein LOC143672863 isoform X2 n=1 Tax=Tamandua tetradactyla TaxID=48850 RepID=UPI00405388E4